MIVLQHGKEVQCCTKYHCHLKYNWVACWIWEKGTFIVEIYYAGSRENAPY